MADPIRAGGAYVELAPKIADSFAADASKQLEPVTKSIGDKIGSIGSTLTKGVTFPLVAGAGALLAAGATIDSALDTIRIGTGKTGDQLAQLDDDFRTVAASVPDSFDKVANTVSGLTQRMGMLSGPVLDALSAQLLTVSRITGTDLNSNMDAAAKLMQNFAVPVEQMPGKLDELFRASQLSGVAFGDLAGQVTSAGPVMRQLGFSLEDTTSLVAQLNKQGIDSGPVMMGMKRALAEFAKAGEDPQKTFARMVQEIHDSKDPIAATQEAMKLFGTRGGAVMAESIRAGRLNFEQFKASMVDGKDTILGAAANTDDFAETFGKMKNQILLAVEPLATKFFDAVSQLVPRLEPLIGYIMKGVDWFMKLSPNVQMAAVAALGFLAVLGPILSILGPLVVAIGAIVSPVGLVIIAIGLLAAGVIYAYTHWQWFRDTVDAVVSWLIGTAWPAIQAFWTQMQAVVAAVVNWLVNDAWPAIRTLIGWIVEGWHGLQVAAEAVWRAIGAVIDWFSNGPLAFIREQVAAVQAFIAQHWDEISQITHAIWEALSTYFRLWWDLVSGIFNVAFAVLKALWEPFWTGLQMAAHIAFDVITTGLKVAWDMIAGLFRAGRDLVATIFGALLDLLTGHWSRAWDTITSGIGKIWDDIGGAISRAGRAALDGLGHVLDDFLHWGAQLGQKIIDGIVNAIKGAAGAIGNAVKGVLKDIPGGGVVADVIGHIPGFASGGTAPPGWAWFGEKGPELVHVGSPSAVINSADSARLMAGTMTSKTFSFGPVYVNGDVDLLDQFRRAEALAGVLG